jgi:predicted kinase
LQVRGGDQGLDLVVLIGLQASGKSTFCRQRLAASHAVVSKHAFRKARHRQRRQMRLVAEALAAGRSVVVDNTNPSPAEWQPLIQAGRAHGATVIGYWFPPDPPGAAARNASRDEHSRVPDVGFYATLGRLRRPHLADGFDRLFAVAFDGAGGFLIEQMTDED